MRTPQLQQKLHELFDRGATIDQAHAAVKKKVSRAVVGRIRKQWKLNRAQGEQEQAKSSAASEAEPQLELVAHEEPNGEAATDQEPVGTDEQVATEKHCDELSSSDVNAAKGASADDHDPKVYPGAPVPPGCYGKDVNCDGTLDGICSTR